jgi:hypothetical protein
LRARSGLAVFIQDRASVQWLNARGPVSDETIYTLPEDIFTDVPELQRQLKAAAVPIAKQADETTNGPASFVVFDPDGNQILVDQL